MLLHLQHLVVMIDSNLFFHLLVNISKAIINSHLVTCYYYFGSSSTSNAHVKIDRCYFTFEVLGTIIVSLFVRRKKRSMIYFYNKIDMT